MGSPPHDSLSLIDPTAGVYLLGAPAMRRDFELGGVAPAARYFTFDELAGAVEAALGNPIAFGEPFTPGTPQARLFAADQTYYWNLAQSAALPLGQLAAPALVHHTQRAAFPAGYVAAVYGTRVDAAMLRAAGYTDDGGPVTGLWWAPGAINVHAGAAQFYLLVQTIDPFGATTAYGYDAYALALTRTIDALGQQITAAYDYQVMQARAVVSVNANTTELLFDPLGEVIATTLYGDKAGQPVGNAPMSAYERRAPATVAEVLANPEKYLQGASSFFCYDLTAWSTGVPVHALTLVRRDWVHWPVGSVPPPPAPPGASLAYFDGALRSLARLSEVEAAAAHPDALRAEATDLVWDVEGQTAYNQRGEAVRSYFAYFAASWAYQAAPAAPVMTHGYDALGRELRTRMPNGTWTRTRYAAWSTLHDDQDDTDPASPFFDTPTTYAVQVQGHTLQETRITTVDGARQPLSTYFVLDVAGNRLRIIDPRFYDPAHPATAASYAFVDQYDMIGQRLSSHGADAGLALTLLDATAQPVATWDGRGNAVAIAYDALRRPTRVSVTADGATRDAERTTYGTDPDTNSVNEVVVHDDQAGVLTYPLYDLLGNARRMERQVLAACGPVDWTDPGKVALLPETWTIDAEHDAANRLVREVNADGSVVEARAYRNGWTERVLLDGAPVVSGFTYDASAHPRAHAYANGMAAAYTYEPLTLRLASAVVAGTEPLQDLAFAYDPVGNVTAIADALTGERRAFTYNAVYQLVGATGVASGGPYTERYTYDQAGNTITQTREGVGGTTTVTIAIAAASNRGVPASILGGDAVDDFFDESGNQRSLVPLALARRLDWDYRNRLIAAAGDTGTAETRYLYDSGGTRVRALRTDGVTTLADEITIGRCVFERGAAPSRTLRVFADATCVLVVRTADQVRQARYQLHDQVASVTLEIGEDQRVLTRETYFPYGETASASGATPADLDDKRYRFNGKQRDAGSELYYYGQRYYAPWQLRWISADPAGTIDGLNLFAFVGGNPVTRYDAHGTNGEDKVPTPKPPRPPSIFDLYRNFVFNYRTPPQTHRTLPYLAKDVSYYTTLAQVSFDAVENVFKHGSTAQLISLAYAANAAKYAGVFGLIYPSYGIYKSLSKGEAPSSASLALFGASLGYLRESQLLFQSLYTHGLSRQIGLTGGGVDVLKVYAALKNDDPKSATGYALFGLGNLRFAGLFPKLPSTAVILTAGLVSQAIPSEYYNFVYRNAVQPAYTGVTGSVSAFFARLTQPPPGGHWTESSNVLIDSLRITTGFRARPTQTPTPRKKQNS